MLRLRTFGGITLFSGESPLTGAATQRRRLAILALLAVGGGRGVSRDKLAALLWPDSDAERARHVLNQLVYAQRRHFGTQRLFTGQKTLRLDPEVIWTDVTAFEAALESDALETAVDLYTGPFLDGFFVRDAPEFERWVETQRDRLARRCGSALGELAERAGAKGDVSRAISWSRRALDQDPLDSDRALRLIGALTAAGNRAEAARVARAHEAELERELGLSVDARFRNSVERLLA